MNLPMLVLTQSLFLYPGEFSITFFIAKLSIYPLPLPNLCPTFPAAFIPPPIIGDIIAPPTKPSSAELRTSSALPPS